MKKILIIYFSQTGQARQAIDAVLKPISANKNFEVHYEVIQPKHKLPYPWKYHDFMDAFPENVQGIPMALEEVKIDLTINFDLIFIVYQPWFLSVCRPMNSFLLTAAAEQLLKDKPVITIINCRNMWLGAQERMKQHLLRLKAKLVGNMVFADHSSNLTSLITVLAFELKGVKEKYLSIFPKYGVDNKDLERAYEIGERIADCLEKNNYFDLQQFIIDKEFVNVKLNLMLMEGRGHAMFPMYSKFILKKGIEASKERKMRVKIFGILLPTAIFILSPVITLVARLTPLLARKKIKKQAAYYQQNQLHVK